MKNKVLAGVALTACGALAWAAKDPVVMTVNGVDVPRSEFEYLYHKNSQQQQDPSQSIDEYAEMFKLYKLKVADARAEGIDTTGAFKKDMAQYRRELSAPYLADSTLLNKLVAEAAARSAQEAEVKHIMMQKTRDNIVNETNRATLDSLRALLLNGADFADLATRYSQDQSARVNHGNMGFFTAGKLPYNFEGVAFSTPEGEVSEIVETPMGYHVIVGGKKRPARGTVHVSHIMKMSRPDAPVEQQAKAKAEIDSIYAVLLADPSKFEALAIELSDDKGSGRQGGLLPWFGAGEMVPEFDAAAFALVDGEISKPVQSMYGWHIIKRINHRAPASLEKMKPEILSRIANPQDDRYKVVRQAQTDRLAAKHKGSVKKANLDLLRSYVEKNGVDSAFYEECVSGSLAPLVIAEIGKKKLTAKEFASGMHNVSQKDPKVALMMLDNYFDGYYNQKLVETEEAWLEANVPDYRNLLNEYREGSLLYEVSLRKVWDKAAKDTDGLEKFFREHRGDYKWNEPRVKGILVQASNDSVANLIRERMAQLGNDTVMNVIRKEFPKQVQLDRVLVKQGDNTMVDNLMFGGKPVTPSNSRYTTYFLFDARKIDAPETAADVRGAVTSDYQNELEQAWIAELKARYPVTVNEKELKKIK